MIAKGLVVIILFFQNISVYSDGIKIYPQLLDCDSYHADNPKQVGILNWLRAVDSVDRCDRKTIYFLSSLGVISLINSDLALLGFEYKYCDGVEHLKRAYNQKYKRLVVLKNSLKQCVDSDEATNKKNIDSLEKGIGSLEKKINVLMEEMENDS